MAKREPKHNTNSTCLGSEPVTLAGGDYTFESQIRGIWCSAAGTVVGRLPQDTADSTWAVDKGFSPLGFTVIRQSSTATIQNGVL